MPAPTLIGKRAVEETENIRESTETRSGGRQASRLARRPKMHKFAGINGNARRHVLCSAVPALSCIDTVRDTATRTTKVHTVNCV
jgi:hypothetical protein